MARRLNAVLAVLLAVLTGCSTIAPRSPGETALVVPVQFRRDTITRVAGEYRLKITGVTDPTVERIGVLSFQHSYQLFTGLKPGRYQVAEVAYFYPDIKRPLWSYDLNRTADLPAGTLTVLPWYFELRLFQDREGQLTLSTGLDTLTEALATRIFTHLTRRDGYEEWKLNPATASLEAIQKALAAVRD